MSSERSILTEAAEASAPGATHNRRVALAGLLLGATAIGFAPIFVRISELGPTATAFYRLLFSLPALWLWYGLEQRRAPRPTATRAGTEINGFVLAGLFFAADLAVWHWSLRFTSVANATLFPNFAPAFVTLAGFLFFGERFSKVFLAGMAIALAGAVILMGESLNLGASHLMGDALALATALFYAGYIVVVGRLRARHGTAKIMAWSGLVTCAALLPVALLSGESLWASSAEGWAVLAALGLFSHALGQSLIAYALAHLPAAFSSVALLLQPAVAALLAWLLLAEALGLRQAAGAAIILAGIATARLGTDLSMSARITNGSRS
jgi:drug/metabolite transporter (DMT)-like permease